MSDEEDRIDAALAAREIASAFSVLAGLLESGQSVAPETRNQLAAACGAFLGALGALVAE
jgi:hypothetical protein